MRFVKGLGGLVLALLLLCRPREAALGAARALSHWYASVVPALLPFLVLMPLLTCSEAIHTYKRLLGRAVERAFGLPGSAAPAMVVGMLAGMPAGAIAARSVAARSGMDQGQLRRLVYMSSGFSPAFLVAGIGTGMLWDVATGWRLLAAQLMTQLTLGLLLRNAWRDRLEPVGEAGIGGSDRPPVLAVLTVGGYMALFGALASVSGSLAGETVARASLCLLDVPSGAKLVAGLPWDATAKAVLLAGMCGFGGLCVAAQGLSVLKGCGFKTAEYLGVRALAALLGAAYMALLARLPGVGGAWLVRGDLLLLAALIASILALPVVFGLKKSIS